MDVSLFDFDLPEDAIALRPANPRDSARLLHMPAEGAFEHSVVCDLPSLFLRPGDALHFDDNLSAVVTEKRDGGDLTLQFNCQNEDLLAAFERCGAPPLPPYIARKRAPDEKDISDYQTVYAKDSGSVAAPTAGLHFTSKAQSRETDIFLTPGSEFHVVDGLMTNFHLPKSTLFMLVSALAGLDRMQAAYKTAIDEGYRFYSYGDSSLIWKNS